LENKFLDKAKKDIIVGLCSLALAVGYYLETYNFRQGNKNLMIGVSFFPRIIGIVISICAVVMIIRGFIRYYHAPKSHSTEAQQNGKQGNKGNMLRVLEVLAILFATAYAMKPLGFVLTMPFTMFSLFVLLEKPEKRKYALYLFFSTISPVVIFFVFYYCFSSLLPMGVLKPLLSQIL